MCQHTENKYYEEERSAGENLVFGNGTMLVYTDGSDISEIRAGGYTSPPILGVNADFGEDYVYSERVRKAYTSTYTHKIYSRVFRSFSQSDNEYPRYSRSLCDIRMTDAVSPDKQIFIRHCENIRMFTLNLNLPPYVRRAFIGNYRIGRKNYDVLSLTLPKGVGFYKDMCSVRDVKMLIVADGDARINSDCGSIDILVGSSRIIFAAGDGNECIENLKELLLDFSFFFGESEHVRASEGFWKDIFSRADKDGLIHNSKHADMLEKALLTLVSQQSNEGGVIASLTEPVVRTCEVLYHVRAFLRLSMPERAKRVLDFFCKRFRSDGKLYQIYGTFDSQHEKYFSDSSLGSSRFIAAFVEYIKNTGDVGFFEENFSVLKGVMYDMFSELALGMLPFSGVEREISEEILGVGVQYNGSLEATLSASSAVFEFVSLCDEYSFRLPHDNGSAIRRSGEMLDAVFKYFVDENKVSLSAPEREAAIKKPRFIYGECDICRSSLSNVYYGELERSATGVYMCPRCYGRVFEFPIRPDREKCIVPQAVAVLLSDDRAAFLIEEPMVARMLKEALDERIENMIHRTVRSDLEFLLLVKKYKMNDYTEFFTERAEFVCLHDFPHTVCGRSVRGRLDTESAACALLALSE